MKFSIIIPVYNAAGTLEKCVRSIMNGVYRNYEIIMVDDGSCDGSSEICDRLAQTDCRLRVLHQANRGAASARNYGISNANGDYIGFVDSDDTVTSDYLDSLSALCKKHRPDIIWFNTRFQNESGYDMDVSSHSHDGLISQKEYLSCFFGMNTTIGSMCNKVYRRDFLSSSGIYLNEHIVYGEDWDFNLRLAETAPTVLLIPDALYNYIKYHTPDTVSSRYHDCDFKNFCESHFRLKGINDKYSLDIDFTEQESLFVYNIISLLKKAIDSNLGHKEKQAALSGIVTDREFRKVLKSGDWDCRFMSKRQKFAARLLKSGLDSLALQLLRI